MSSACDAGASSMVAQLRSEHQGQPEAAHAAPQHRALQQHHGEQPSPQQQQAQDASVDLATIDVREQQRILAMIQAGRQGAGAGGGSGSGSTAAAHKRGRGSKERAPPSNGSGSNRGGSATKRAAPSSSGGGSGLRQRSLRGFFSPPGSSPAADHPS